MPVQTESVTTGEGRELLTFTLTNAAGTTLRVTNYGAIILQLIYAGPDGRQTDLVLGFDSAEDYLAPVYLNLAANPYFGAVIGRFANRISKGRFSIDGNQYQLAQNLAPEHLHGGVEGFNKKFWELVSSSDAPNPQVSMRYTSPDGEEGYPGKLEAGVRYELTEGNELVIDYTATTDAPTLYNPTNHSYFNLDGLNGSVENHVLRIPAPVILEQDHYFTPTGNLLRVEDSIYDFREPRKVGLDWDPVSGYDQSFVVEPDFRYPAAEIFSPVSRIRMEVFSTAPMIHFYTGSGLSGIHGKNGNVYEKFAGFSLETQLHPNGINIPNFPDAILRPDETFSSRTMYKFSTDPA
ncbi:MAG: galactose mutarotase [Chitinophagaceae bacterium]|nr:MAG: galactose mutarotase [Chitinophagaceae bacterium]